MKWDLKRLDILWLLLAFASAICLPLWLIGEGEAKVEPPPPLQGRALDMAPPAPIASWRGAAIFSADRQVASPVLSDSPLTSSFGTLGAPSSPIEMIASTIPSLPTDTAPTVKTEAAPPSLPSLKGTIIGRGRDMALVTDDKGIARKMTRGQYVNGWRLERVNRNGAVFSYKGQVRDVKLGYEQQNLSGGRGPAPPQPLEPVAVPSYRDAAADAAEAAVEAAAEAVGEVSEIYREELKK